MTARNALAPFLLGGFTAWRALSGHRDPPQAFRILMLHDIPERHRGALDRLLSWIGERHGFISPTEAEALLSGKVTDGASRVPVLVSFDDGFISNHSVARAVLAAHDVRAIFFICPGLIDLAPEAQKAALAKRLYRAQPPAAFEPLMGWEQIGNLREDGHLIAAHTMTHRDISSLQGDALEEEIIGAGARIRDETGAWPDWFAWPFGDIAAIDAGALGVIADHYKYCRSGIRGVNAPGGSDLELFADHVDLDASFSWQKLALEGGLDGRYRSARARLAEMIQTADR